MYVPTIGNRTLGVKPKRLFTITALLILSLVLVISLNVSTVLPGLLGSPGVAQSTPPLSFVPNVGQTDTAVHFQAHDLGGALYFQSDSVQLSLPGEEAGLSLDFIGANPDVTVSGGAELPGKVNYILGNDPALWQTGVETYESVVYTQLYPGIDLYYDGANGRLKGTYHVAPGADPGLIRWRHTGATSVAINPATGSLQMTLAGSGTRVTEQAPIAWQVIDGKQIPVAVQYSMNSNGAVGFALGAYETTHPLIIDPTLVYSFFTSGDELDSATDIAIDNDGNAYITGLTNSSDFPNDHNIGIGGGFMDAFVIKVDADGNSVYSTIIGGDDADQGISLDVDSAGNVYLVGTTSSTNFPTQSAAQASNGGTQDAFILKLNTAGSGLVYSTYLGGSGGEDAQDISVDTTGAAVVVGSTSSANFPTKSAYDDARNGVNDAFVTKLNSAGSDWVFSTYLGGGNLDSGAGVAIDGSGAIYVVGQTLSDDFPTNGAVQSNRSGNYDLFVTKLNASGTNLQYSTYIGGDSADYAYAIALTDGNEAVVVGETYSDNYPTTSDALMTDQGGTDAFVTMLNSAGSGYAYSTYLGGELDDAGYSMALDKAFDVAVDADENIYVVGSTVALDFPTENPLQADYAGMGDAFVAKMNGGVLEYSTYLGGSSTDHGHGIDVDDAGNAYVTGISESSNFPTATGATALDHTADGGQDVYIVKISSSGSTPIPPPPPEPDFSGSTKTASESQLGPDDELTFTIRLYNSGGAAGMADVVDDLPAELEYVAGSATGGGVYDATAHSVTWDDVSVDSDEEVLLTFEVTAVDSITDPTPVVNTATITPDGGDPIERSAGVLLLPEDPPVPPASRPVVNSFRIDDQDVLTDTDVTLYIDATDDGSVESMYLREWQLSTTPLPRWEIVADSGWIPYEDTYDWTLGDAAGTHYMAVWVTDDDGNKSLLSTDAADYASLLQPDTEVDFRGLVPYLVYYEAGESVTATLTPSSGDADLYVWYPDSFGLPDQKSINGGTAVDEVTFTAPEDGTYLILVHGHTAATYDLSIMPSGGPTVTSSTSNLQVQVADKDGELTSEPVLSQSGLSPLPDAETPEGPYHLYLPVISR